MRYQTPVFATLIALNMWAREGVAAEALVLKPVSGANCVLELAAGSTYTYSSVLIDEDCTLKVTHVDIGYIVLRSEGDFTLKGRIVVGGWDLAEATSASISVSPWNGIQSETIMVPIPTPVGGAGGGSSGVAGGASAYGNGGGGATGSGEGGRHGPTPGMGATKNAPGGGGPWGAASDGRGGGGGGGGRRGQNGGRIVIDVGGDIYGAGLVDASGEDGLPGGDGGYSMGSRPGGHINCGGGGGGGGGGGAGGSGGLIIVRHRSTTPIEWRFDYAGGDGGPGGAAGPTTVFPGEKEPCPQVSTPGEAGKPGVDGKLQVFQ